MSTTAPHYLLLTETNWNSHRPEQGGRWRFVLEPMNPEADLLHRDTGRVEVSEREADIQGERLDLLAVVRGVEALEQPSRLTLITSSDLIGKQIRRGFDRWIEMQWRWERFGQLRPIKHADLWQRISAAMQIHSIECRIWQFGTRAASADFETLEDAKPWARNDDAHPQFNRPHGPTEFEPQRRQVGHQEFAKATVGSVEQPNFVATKTGWTRVTEIDPDQNRSLQFPLAFGETAH